MPRELRVPRYLVFRWAVLGAVALSASFLWTRMDAAGLRILWSAGAMSIVGGLAAFLSVNGRHIGQRGRMIGWTVCAAAVASLLLVASNSRSPVPMIASGIAMILTSGALTSLAILFLGRDRGTGWAQLGWSVLVALAAYPAAEIIGFAVALLVTGEASLLPPRR